MKSKIPGLLVVVLLPLVPTVSSASPACTESFNLGVMGPPALQLIGNDFTGAGSYRDCYAFSLSSAADAFGFVLEFDGSIRRDIDVLSVALYSADLLLAEDLSPSSFSYSSLAAGDSYSLLIASEVTGLDGGFLGGGLVGYAGSFMTTSASTAPVAVPEPATLALLGAGLAGAGLARRRRTIR